MDEKRKTGNIILSGFMGCGKSSIGRRLAAQLHMEFVDMDRYIEQREGKTVREIFDAHGEAHFRALERAAVQTLAGGDRYVVATGGGTLMQSGNAEAFRAGGGTIYFLDVPLAALQERLKNDHRRPLLQVPDRRAVIERLFYERRPRYLETADITVDAGAPTMIVVRRIAALRGVELPPPQKRESGEKRRKKHRRRRRRNDPGAGKEKT